MADPEPEPLPTAPGNISDLITTIISTLTTYTTGILIKADTEEWEKFPGYGIGTPTIHEVDELGTESRIDVDIPIVIVDAGNRPDVNLNLTRLYELLRLILTTKLLDEIEDETIPVDAYKFEDFQPIPIPQDNSIRGLIGTLSFRMIY